MASATVEEYLETIYMIAAEGKPVKGARLASALHVSRPTVTATVRRMRRDGLISLGVKKEIALTKEGWRIAEELQRRHRIVERWLTDVIQLDWAESDAEAHRLEHAVSDKVVERLNELLQFPATCPHGNPIPGNGSVQDMNAFPLVEARQGDQLRVTRISEYAENTGEMLRHLGERGLKPGAELTVEQWRSREEPLALRLNGKRFALPAAVAEYVWVFRDVKSAA